MQPRRDMKAVRELVALHAQRISHRRDRLEAIREGHDIGAIPDHGYQAEIPIGARHRASVDEHDMVGEYEGFRGIRWSPVRRRPGQGAQHRRGQIEPVDAAADQV